MGAEGLEPPTFALYERHRSAGQDLEALERCTDEYQSVPLSTSEYLYVVTRGVPLTGGSQWLSPVVHPSNEEPSCGPPLPTAGYARHLAEVVVRQPQRTIRDAETVSSLAYESFSDLIRCGI